MPKEKLLIVGLTRNCEKNLVKTYEILKNAFQDFELSWLIIESDSNDSTIGILEKLSKSDASFKFKSFGNLKDTMPFRTQRIAFCRNYYTDEVRSNPYFSDFKYVAAADFDGINSLLTRQAVLSCWEIECWDVVSANQKGRYYDIWCLRHISWSPDDCWKKYADLRKSGQSHFKASRNAVYSRMVQIKKEAPWIEVDSAYGGLTIYKKQAFISGTHVWQDSEGIETCEIVQYNVSIKSHGYRIFINPKLINGGINEHSRQSFFYHQFYLLLKGIVKGWKQ
jgi:hypothetical protein